MEAIQFEALEQGANKEVVILNSKQFDIKRVLMQLLPSLMTIITGFLVTGKLTLPKGMDKEILRTLLLAILDELG